MPGDISRRTFIKDRHYAGVQAQQGRVLSDADLNEQLEIGHHRIDTEAIDAIGSCGVPKALDSFRIGKTPDGLDLTISPGRIYVDGLLCELDAEALPLRFPAGLTEFEAVAGQLFANSRPLEAGFWAEIEAPGKTSKVVRITDIDTPARILTFSESLSAFQGSADVAMRIVETYTTQADYPEPDFAAPSLSPPGFSSADLPDGTYLAYVAAFLRDINYIDDPHVRETALGGPDTATRLQTVKQVRLLKVTPPAGKASCKTTFPEWEELIAGVTGKVNARTQPPAGVATPCVLPPSASFRSLENQLYRVEIQRGGTIPPGPQPIPTFKWSREDGSVETAITVNGNTMVASDIGKDNVLGFAGGQWVEIVDDESSLKLSPHTLVQLDQIKPATREITTVQTISGFSGRSRLKMRRWDQTGVSATENGVVTQSGVWLDLEDGVQVIFSAGRYRSGDYWLIPARTGTGEIEWPPFDVPNTHPIPQPPVGVRRHYCRLALITAKGGAITIVEDCREKFPPLTHIAASDVSVDGSQCLGLSAAATVQDALDILCENSEIASPFVSGVFKRGLYGKLFALQNGDTILGAELAQGLLVQLTGKIEPANATPAACFVILELPFTAFNQVVGFEMIVLAATVVANGPATIVWTPVLNTRRFLISQLSLVGGLFSKDWETLTENNHWQYADGAAQATWSTQQLSPPIAVSTEPLVEAATSLFTSIGLPGGIVAGTAYSAGVIFNFSSANDYWELRFTSGLVPSGTGSFSDISGIRLTHLVGGRDVASTNVFLPGVNSPNKLDITINQSPGKPLAFLVKYTMPGQYPVQAGLSFAAAPQTLEKGSRVGIFSQWRGTARFTSMTVNNPSGLRTVLPAQLLSRLTVKRDFLLNKTGPGASHPDFSMWLSVVPSQAYGYGAAGAGIGTGLL